jgi:hypothetical protein
MCPLKRSPSGSLYQPQLKHRSGGFRGLFVLWQGVISHVAQQNLSRISGFEHQASLVNHALEAGQQTLLTVNRHRLERCAASPKPTYDIFSREQGSMRSSGKEALPSFALSRQERQAFLPT